MTHALFSFAPLSVSLPFVAAFFQLAAGHPSHAMNPEEIPAGQKAMVDKTMNLSLYGSRAEKLTLAQIQEWVGEAATIETLDGTDVDWENIAIVWPDLTVRMNTTSIDSDGTLEFLGQFQAYVYGQLAGGEMDRSVFSVYRQIGRTNNMYSLTAEKPLHRECIALARAIADSEKAMIFSDGQVLDNQFRLLLGPDRSRDEEAKIPVFRSAVERRVRSRELLLKRSLKPIKLPEVVGDEAVRLRRTSAVARRFLCLATVAMKADHQDKFDADKFIAEHDLRSSLTPDEVEFLASPTEQSNSTMTWRYEAAWTLLWALKQTEEIGFPDSESDANLVIQAAVNNAASILASKELRPTRELLDQMDVLYLCNWIITEARVQEESTEGLDGSVVYERLYALNWLVFDGNADWDDVRTNS